LAKNWLGYIFGLFSQKHLVTLIVCQLKKQLPKNLDKLLTMAGSGARTKKKEWFCCTSFFSQVKKQVVVSICGWRESLAKKQVNLPILTFFFPTKEKRNVSIYRKPID
jgi:hypothetical protein